MAANSDEAMLSNATALAATASATVLVLGTDVSRLAKHSVRDL
eukprot:SAG31_NODE_12275_length_953_cov_1.104215_2_plen_42_part_01